MEEPLPEQHLGYLCQCTHRLRQYMSCLHCNQNCCACCGGWGSQVQTTMGRSSAGRLCRTCQKAYVNKRERPVLIYLRPTLVVYVS